MGTKRTKTNGQESLMEDVWAAVAAAEQEFTTVARLTLLRNNRKGVWKVRYDVFSVVDRRPHTRLVEISGEWPNSQAQTLEAYALQKVTEGYNRLVEAVQVLKDQASF